jgi:hypothetical protein
VNSSVLAQGDACRGAVGVKPTLVRGNRSVWRKKQKQQGEVEMRIQIELLDKQGSAIINDVYDGTVPVPNVGEVVSIGGNAYTVTNRMFHYLTLRQREKGDLPDVKVTLILERRHQLTAQGHRA